LNADSISDTLTTVADSLQQAGDTGSGWILHHVMDGKEIEIPFVGYVHIPQIQPILGIDITPTKHVVFMLISALLLLIIFTAVARQYKSGLIPKRLANFFEVMIIFVKDEIAVPTLGKAHSAFLPFLLTLFFFILFGNFLGLIPFSATFTSNIAVTAALAIVSFIVIQLGGIRQNGLLGYFKGLIPHGIPTWLLPLMIPVEILGMFTKPFALAIRLFANMIAGHTVILALLGLIFFMGTIFIAPVSVAFAVFIYLLEILVALIQAYVFTMLTALFIGMTVHQEH
jgi:F-type H+-transporting ATPase subunit a